MKSQNSLATPGSSSAPLRKPAAQRLDSGKPQDSRANPRSEASTSSLPEASRTSLFSENMGPRPGAPRLRRTSLEYSDPEVASSIVSTANFQLKNLLKTNFPESTLMEPGYGLMNVTHQGFDSPQSQILDDCLKPIREATFGLIPHIANDILILHQHTGDQENPDLARTLFHGKASDIHLNYDAHQPEGRTLDQLKGRIIQTLAHEIGLHILKRALIVQQEGRTISGWVEHADACIVEARENYFNYSCRVYDALENAEQKAVFAAEWRKEIKDLANMSKTGLFKHQIPETEQWADQRAQWMQDPARKLARTSDLPDT